MEGQSELPLPSPRRHHLPPPLPSPVQSPPLPTPQRPRGGARLPPAVRAAGVLHHPRLLIWRSGGGRGEGAEGGCRGLRRHPSHCRRESSIKASVMASGGRGAGPSRRGWCSESNARRGGDRSARALARAWPALPPHSMGLAIAAPASERSHGVKRARGRRAARGPRAHRRGDGLGWTRRAGRRARPGLDAPATWRARRWAAEDRTRSPLGPRPEGEQRRGRQDGRRLSWPE